MVEAKNFPTFLIEGVGADITNPSSFTVRKWYQDTETTTTYPNTDFSQLLQDISTAFCESSTSVGCRIYLKNGTYKIDQGPDTSGGLVEWSSQTEGSHVSVYMEGETRDGCIIQNIETTPEETPTSRIFLCRCNFSLNNLTVDGGGDIITGGNTLNGVSGFGQSSGSPVLEGHNCRFRNVSGTNFSVGANWSTFIVDGCIFEKPIRQADQCNCELDPARAGFIIVKNNFFDRTNGTYTGAGSSFTTGGAHDLIFTGNIVKRLSANAGGYGVSLETFWAQPSSNCIISNNLLDNCLVVVGQGGGAADQQAYQCYIKDNTIYQGGIHVEGPTGAGDYIKDIFIEGNLLLDSWKEGIYVKNNGGFVSVRNNTIKNSNKSLGTFTGQETLIYLNSCTDVFCENNLLYMGVVSPANAAFSPQGIRFTGLVNSTIRNNRILNRTVANNSYQDNGSNTGCIISKSL